MEKQKLIKLIDVAAGRKKADLVLKNAKIVDVFQAKILTGDIAISDGYIAGIGESYQGVEERNYTGKYVAPGFIFISSHPMFLQKNLVEFLFQEERQPSWLILMKS